MKLPPRDNHMVNNIVEQLHLTKRYTVALGLKIDETFLNFRFVRVEKLSVM